MQSTLIISSDKTRSLAEAIRLCDSFTIDIFDRTLIERGEAATSKTGETKLRASLGIEEVKQLQKTLSLKPFRGENKAIIITEGHLLTTEAQNALLKILEEPPGHTIIILCAESTEAILPTILSRCKIVTLVGEEQVLPEKELLIFSEIVQSLPNWGVGKSLYQAEILAKNKTDAIQWLERCIIASRSLLIENATSETPNLMKQQQYQQIIVSFEKIRRQTKNTNANLRLSLENLLLGPFK